jgi:UDP-glucose 4-epimerase
VVLHHVVELLQQISGMPAGVTFETKQHGDVRHTFADTWRAQQLIGYYPRVSLQDGLTWEFEYVQSKYKQMVGVY